MTTLKYYAHMFPNNDLELATKMEGSMNLRPAKNSRVEFNGNQNISGRKIIGLPKVCQFTKKSA